MITESPERLLEQADDLAELLAQAKHGYAQGLHPERAFSRIQAKNAANASFGRWLLACAVATSGVALLLAQPWRNHEREAALLVTPEAVVAGAARPASALDNPPDSRSMPQKPLAKSRRPATGQAGARSVESNPASGSPAPIEAALPHAAAAVAPASSAEPGAEDCLAYARSGEPRRAAACFTAHAAGSGLSAQVALYELSRLQRDALGEPAAALESLTQYLQRFPSGSLNGEARFSRLELLARLGRTSEALTASSDFLSSPFGAERAPEVHLFRGNLLLSGGSPARAVTEYRAALGAPGRVGDDAAYELALALESSGAKTEAQQAYEHYLARPGGRHRSAATARLAELAP